MVTAYIQILYQNYHSPLLLLAKIPPKAMGDRQDENVYFISLH